MLQRIGRCRLLSVAFSLVVVTEIDADSWPSHRHDSARSGISSEQLSLPLEDAWVFASRYPPQPAWSGPARRDGWHKVDHLKARMIFDWAFHVVMSDDAVFFGSSADDQVYALDADDGRVRWSFFTESPVRLAPTVASGRVFVGSDDGFVYCLEAVTGELVWKVRGAPQAQRVSGNGRLMSLWPVRSGVAIVDNTAYFCAGLFPFEGAYLCAVSVDDGSVVWRHKLDFLAPQGYILASASRLYVPMGRGRPAIFDRRDGRHVRTLGGSGGTFCLLTDDLLIYGPGKTGQLEAFKTEVPDQLATFQGNQMVVTPGSSYLHTDTELTALDRSRYREIAEARLVLVNRRESVKEQLKKTANAAAEAANSADELRQLLSEIEEKIAASEMSMRETILWRRSFAFPYSLVLAGDLLLAGGNDRVAAVSRDSGETMWSAAVTGRALDLAVASGRLIVSTDRGTIHCFRSRSAEGGD